MGRGEDVLGYNNKSFFFPCHKNSEGFFFILGSLNDLKPGTLYTYLMDSLMEAFLNKVFGPIIEA